MTRHAPRYRLLRDLNVLHKLAAQFRMLVIAETGGEGGKEGNLQQGASDHPRVRVRGAYPFFRLQRSIAVLVRRRQQRAQYLFRLAPRNAKVVSEDEHLLLRQLAVTVAIERAEHSDCALPPGTLRPTAAHAAALAAAVVLAGA